MRIERLWKKWSRVAGEENCYDGYCREKMKKLDLLEFARKKPPLRCVDNG